MVLARQMAAHWFIPKSNQPPIMRFKGFFLRPISHLSLFHTNDYPVLSTYSTTYVPILAHK